jgi:hypothetical protein
MKHRIEHAVQKIKPGRPEPILPMVVLVLVVVAIIAASGFIIGKL